MIILNFYRYELEQKPFIGRCKSSFRYMSYKKILDHIITVETLSIAKDKIRDFLDNYYGFVDIIPFRMTVNNKKDFLQKMDDRGIHAVYFTKVKMGVDL
jgi:hypothetical protein